MDRKESVKMEDGMMGSSSFLDYFHGGVFDLSEGDNNNGSLGFMELLGAQDFGFSPLFDVGQMASTAAPTSVVPNLGGGGKIESPEVLNQPVTPNSSSISSESCQTVNDEPVKAEEQEEDQQKTKKMLKPKKTSQKRQREPRFAFMTKSEVDHLEDGYRWRKYGQKAVKNSPFPRSYYRCTTSSCNVKKRVERSFNDPSIVVTTYEGQHTHPSPIMPRPSLSGGGAAAPATFAMPMQRNTTCIASPYDNHHHQIQHQFFLNSLSTMNPQNGSGFVHERQRFCNNAPTNPALLEDHGLLEDIIPGNIIMKEE